MSMARKHDLSIRRWAPWEDRLIVEAARDNLERGIRRRANGNAGSRYAALAARLGRTRCAVSMRASRIGARSQHGHGRTVIGLSLLPVVAPAGADGSERPAGTPAPIRGGGPRTAGGPAHAPMAEGVEVGIGGRDRPSLVNSDPGIREKTGRTC